MKTLAKIMRYIKNSTKKEICSNGHMLEEEKKILKCNTTLYLRNQKKGQKSQLVKAREEEGKKNNKNLIRNESTKEQKKFKSQNHKQNKIK